MNYTLITGASSGIGLELSKVFAKYNHNLLLIDINKKKLVMLKVFLEKMFCVNVDILEKDLIKEDCINEIYKYTKEKNYIIDNLVNNAGYGYHSIFVDSNYDVERDMIKLNILALMKLSYLYGKDMKKRKSGKMLNVSSLAAFMRGPYLSTDYATKSFVLSFSLGLMEELKEYGVSVTTLCPPPTKTNFKEFANLNDSYMFKLFIQANPYNVAKYGYNKMMQKCPLAYYNLYTKIGNILSRVLPKNIIIKITKFINQKPI